MRTEPTSQPWPAGPLVLAPGAIWRAAAGTLHVHTGVGVRHFHTDDAALAAWLMAFVRPQAAADALASLPEDRRAAAAEALRQCVAIAALVAAGDAQLRPHGPPPQPQLALLADTLQQVAGTIEAMGGQAETLLAQGTGIGLADRLAALTSAAMALRSALDAARQEFVAAQLRALALPADVKNLRLHLGCGGHRLAGWINIDAGPADLALDLRWGLPFADASCSHVFMAHAFEHLYYPDEAQDVLAEIRRVLARGGRLRMVVPDIGLWLKAYVENDEAFFRDRQRTWHWWQGTGSRLGEVLAYGGAGPRASQFMESHKFGYDYETLAGALRQAGFQDVERSAFQASPDPVLQVDDASLVAAAASGARPYSLFVEAVA